MRDVVIEAVLRTTRGYWVLGRVKSRSKPDTWHEVEVVIEWVNGFVVLRGKCDCPAFARGHMPCHHMVHLANSFIRRRVEAIH